MFLFNGIAKLEKVFLKKSRWPFPGQMGMDPVPLKKKTTVGPVVISRGNFGDPPLPNANPIFIGFFFGGGGCPRGGGNWGTLRIPRGD